ncbi:hypothetical protein RR46_07793 [Papilio xuthus]|uniref:Uncharacterized protein n=1 Tax=Papilio xuthus TaxID=66420 RepID=A0A194QF39_PAPXU|nr:hypothetical protein RR46_07793 [Papilio xuthus]
MDTLKGSPNVATEETPRTKKYSAAYYAQREQLELAAAQAKAEIRMHLAKLEAELARLMAEEKVDDVPSTSPVRNSANEWLETSQVQTSAAFEPRARNHSTLISTDRLPHEHVAQEPELSHEQENLSSNTREWLENSQVETSAAFEHQARNIPTLISTEPLPHDDTSQNQDLTHGQKETMSQPCTSREVSNLTCLAITPGTDLQNNSSRYNKRSDFKIDYKEPFQKWKLNKGDTKMAVIEIFYRTMSLRMMQSMMRATQQRACQPPRTKTPSRSRPRRRGSRRRAQSSAHTQVTLDHMAARIMFVYNSGQNLSSTVSCTYGERTPDADGCQHSLAPRVCAMHLRLTEGKVQAQNTMTQLDPSPLHDYIRNNCQNALYKDGASTPLKPGALL